MSAMQVELNGLEKKLLTAASNRFANGHLFQGSFQGEPLAWVISGIGRANAQLAVSEVAKNFQVDTLLSLGFAGSLAPEPGIGDLVICKNIGSAMPHSQSYQPEARLLETAFRVGERLQCRVWLKDCLTVENLLHLPEDKAALYARWKYDIVEMENFWMAEESSRLGLNFLAVRAISDTAQDILPDFDGVLDSSGELSFRRGMQHFARHPQEIRLLLPLYRNSKLARRNLLEFLDIFTPEWSRQKGNLAYVH